MPGPEAGFWILEFGFWILEQRAWELELELGELGPWYALRNGFHALSSSPIDGGLSLRRTVIIATLPSCAIPWLIPSRPGLSRVVLYITNREVTKS